MKDSKRCPKCDSTDIVRIGPQRHSVVNSGKGVLDRMSFGNLIAPTGYLCCECGLIESYIEISKDRQNLKAKYGETKPKLSKRRKKTRTFNVGKKKKVKAPPPPQDAPSPDAIETRLQRLEKLKEKGLINEEEFLSKRREIEGEGD